MSTQLLTGKLTFTSLKPLDLSSCTKEELTAYFENSYDLNESLFTALKDTISLYKCPDRLRLPLIFYYAHTAAVYVNKLMLGGLIKERVNLAFETMFETGVDEMSWDDTENYRMGGSYKWPSVEDVVEYRRNVRNIIMKLIADTPLELPITMDSPWWALCMGMEHERIHLETSSVLLRQLPVHMLQKPESWTYAPPTSAKGHEKNVMVQVDGGEVTLGKPKDFPSYGWDNEYGQFQCKVPAFKASQFLISNQEFLEFVLNNGYSKKELWTEEGWRWVQFRQAKHPTFWVCDKGCKSGCGADLASYSHCNITIEGVQNGLADITVTDYTNHTEYTNNAGTKFMYRAMFDVLEMPWDWPVDVNYHEAKAFCHWKGPNYRLPSEAEHHLMRGPKNPVTQGTKSDIIFQDKLNANINLCYGSSTPVNMYPPTEAGFYDVFGNVWEWTEDQFNGLDNFDTHFLYDDFSTPCFDGKHNIIMGGSWVSTGDEASCFARFAFRRHFFQHMGFRVVYNVFNENDWRVPVRMVSTKVFVLGGEVDDNVPKFDSLTNGFLSPSTNKHYQFDSNVPLHGILELEFGFRDSLPAAAATYAANLAQAFRIPTTTALCVGCSTGRGAFELSKHFQQVVGVECCAKLVDAALHLQTSKHLTLEDKREITLDTEVHAERVIFKQLTWLPNEIKQHNLVLVSILERVQNPKAWLLRLWEVTAPRGLIVIVNNADVWNKETLEPQLSNRLFCVDTQQLPYTSFAGQDFATITVWRHK